MKFRISFLLLTALLLTVAPSSGFTSEVGKRLPSFNSKTMDGRSIQMDNIIGKKPVLLVFWASWCPSCKSEVPRINELVEKYRAKGMEFIGINIGSNDSPKRAKAFMKKTGMTYPVVFDKSGKISSQYRIVGVPTIIVADSAGVVQFKNYGTPNITDKVFQILNSK